MQSQFTNNQYNKRLYNSKNKQNNLSFRNIAANCQSNQNLHSVNTKKQQKNVSQSFVKPYNTNTNNHNDSQYEIKNSFYYSRIREDQNNYAGSSIYCVNHKNKTGEYFEVNTLMEYCKLCAAKLASLGYKLQKIDKINLERDLSPKSINQSKFKPKESYSNKLYTQKSQSRIKTNTNTVTNSFSSNNLPKFCNFGQSNTYLNDKNRYYEMLDNEYEDSQRKIEQEMMIYNEYMQKIEELINDIRIKDTQYFNKLKIQNRMLYDEARNGDYQQTLSNGYDLFGKSLATVGKSFGKEQDENFMIPKFKVSTGQKTEKIILMLDEIEKILNNKQFKANQMTNVNNVALIKSVNSIESQNNNKLKNSSSTSNLSSKSNFIKKQRIVSVQKNQIQRSQDLFKNEKKQSIFVPKSQQQDDSKRFSTNSNLNRNKSPKNYDSSKKVEKTQTRKKTITQISLGDSQSCEDTPESMKSKISGNTFVLPRNAAITMFQKINICESIDVKPQECKAIQNQSQVFNFGSDIEINNKLMEKNIEQSKGSYTNKNDNKSTSQVSKSRKSFHRYNNFDCDQ